jgi:elongation factor 1-gamma
MLEESLINREYLVGDKITLADIFVAIMLSRGLEWVLDATWRYQHPNCMRHFEMLAQWEPVKTAVLEFKLVEKEPENRSPYE